MSDDEPDYMSDDFLKNCGASDDIRPGLLFSRRQRREAAAEHSRKLADEQHRQQNRPRAHVEKEQRERGLAQPIDSSNKGFAMLQMMGYKPGTAIGKQGQGRLEPVGVQLKSDRGGLGRQAALQEVRRRKCAILAARRRHHCAAHAADQFRQRMRDKMADRYQQSDLMKSQRVCQQLDERTSVESPAESWFWPNAPEKNTDEQQQNQTTASDTEEDDKRGVPEQQRPQEEQEQVENEEDTVQESSDDAEEVVPEFSCSEKLELLTAYLRRNYFYCVWCGCDYADAEDLSEQCPGQSREHHD